MLEPDFVQPLGLVVDALTLKEHGVEIFCVLESQPSMVPTLLDRGVQHVVYLVRSRLPSIQAAVAHVAMCRDAGAALQYSLLLMPRKMKVSEMHCGRSWCLPNPLKSCPVMFMRCHQPLVPHATCFPTNASHFSAADV